MEALCVAHTLRDDAEKADKAFCAALRGRNPHAAHFQPFRAEGRSCFKLEAERTVMDGRFLHERAKFGTTGVAHPGAEYLPFAKPVRSVVQRQDIGAAVP